MRRLALLRRERLAGLDAFEPAEGDSVARMRLAALRRLLAEQGENAGDALVIGAAMDRGAVGEGAGQHAGKRQLAAVRGVKRLEDVGARRRVSDPEALRCGSDKRGFMPERLEQAQNAVAILGRAEQNGADQPAAKFRREIVEHLVARRRHVLEQLLHQLVVIVGEFLQHREPRLFLAVRQGVGNGDHLARRVLAIDEGAFQREIDEAGDDVVLPDRHLAQHQRLAACRLQHRHDVADARLGLVDLVDEQEVGNAAIFQLLQDQL